ncbi:hypothetical protein Q31b_42860 [Novipirellula aureliae]|uniref:Uncharacterized protein n=1 Tax=Novipirellula aureliae TaxID=2527966 RepID=A0A5C6DL50_9BACT|nr:hypothetical protein [Novipirellula aureliae]TWU37498.1 hypothetical protein Q31b_42860 [Novipirellula aureliae]
MHTFQLTLVPHGGGTPITVQIQAYSDLAARRIAEASYRGYIVRAIHMVH